MGGLIFVIATLLIAALFGGLADIIAACVAAIITYFAVFMIINAIPRRVANIQRRLLDEKLDALVKNGADPKRIDAFSAKADKELAAIETKTKEQEDGNKFVAGLVAVAAAAWPPLLPILGIVIAIVFCWNLWD